MGKGGACLYGAGNAGRHYDSAGFPRASVARVA